MAAEVALSEAEAAFLSALTASGTRFLFVGMAAAVAQGGLHHTENFDFWFERQDPKIMHAAVHAADAGGFYSARTSPPMIGGEAFDRIDLVMSCSGLDSFEDEYARAVPLDLDGVTIMALPVDRIIVSKTAANRDKDRAVLPALRATLAAIEDAAKP